MKRIICFSILALIVGLVPAMADTWNFTFDSGSGGPFEIQATGTFNTNSVGLPGTIVGLTGTFTLSGVDPLLVVPPIDPYTDSMTLLAPGAFASNDNVFVGPSQYFTINGLSFKSGLYDWNIFYSQPASGQGGYVYTVCETGSDCITDNSLGVPSAPIQFSATQVPDGGMTVTLLGAGLFGLAALRLRFRA